MSTKAQGFYRDPTEGFEQTYFYGEKIYQETKRDEWTSWYPATGVESMREHIVSLAKENDGGMVEEGPSRLKTAVKAEGIVVGVLLLLAVMAVAGVSLGMRLDTTFNTHATQFFTNLTLKQGLLYFGTPGFSLIAIALAALAIAAIKDKRERDHDDSALRVDADQEMEATTVILLRTDHGSTEPSWFEKTSAQFQAWLSKRSEGDTDGGGYTEM